MRRRNPHDSPSNMPAPDYSPVSQDPENPTTKKVKSSLLPRSYNGRRRLGLVAVCVAAGLGILATVKIFQSSKGEEGMYEH